MEIHDGCEKSQTHFLKLVWYDVQNTLGYNVKAQNATMLYLVFQEEREEKECDTNLCTAYLMNHSSLRYCPGVTYFHSMCRITIDILRKKFEY